jgi:hypothetical protein
MALQIIQEFFCGTTQARPSGITATKLLGESIAMFAPLLKT